MDKLTVAKKKPVMHLDLWGSGYGSIYNLVQPKIFHGLKLTGENIGLILFLKYNHCILSFYRRPR
jgi:hypothetical protein